MKLISHPKYPAHNKLSLSSDIQIIGQKCHIRYKVIGDISPIVINEGHTPQFRDELWKMTCFEMFVQNDNGPQYYEYNFAPNGDWASYSFDDYRNGMTAIEINQPDIALSRSDDMIEVHVIMDINALPTGHLNIGLFAMIFTDDDRSYWALEHSEDTPNFHQRDCFLHPLTAR